MAKWARRVRVADLALPPRPSFQLPTQTPHTLPSTTCVAHCEFATLLQASAAPHPGDGRRPTARIDGRLKIQEDSAARQEAIDLGFFLFCEASWNIVLLALIRYRRRGVIKDAWAVGFAIMDVLARKSSVNRAQLAHGPQALTADQAAALIASGLPLPQSDAVARLLQPHLMAPQVLFT